MSRLIVANSTLSYPLPPADYRGDGDVLLPIPEYFEEAMFLQSPFHDHYYDRMAEYYWQAEGLARKMAQLLPDAVASPPEAVGHSAWEAFIGSLIKFTLGPLMVASETVESACSEIEPETVVAWDEPQDVAWWGGRQLVADTARRAGELTGARVKLRSSGGLRLLRNAIHPLTVRANAGGYFLRQMGSVRDPRPGEYDVIIAPLGRTVRGLVEAIGQGLNERGLSVLVVEIPTEPLDPVLEDVELPHANLYDFREPWMVRSGLCEVAQSLGWHRRFAAEFASESSFPLEGALRNALVRRMQNVLTCDIPSELYHQRLWSRVFDVVRPRTLLAFNHYGTALAPGVLHANERGMATVLSQHGMGSPHWRSTTILPFDLALTFGDFARETQESVAYERTEFAMTGHSGWDDLRSAPELQRPDPDGAPIVLATTQTAEKHLRAAEPAWWLRELAVACEKLGARLVIKPHPNESDTGDYRALADSMEQTVRFVPHGERPLADLVGECAVLATRYSTTAIQAIIAGKPVMTVFPTGARERYPFAAEGAGVKVNSCDELLPTLRALLTDNELHERLNAQREQFIKRHVGPLDGGATERIIEYVMRRTSQAAPNHPDR